MSMKRRETDRQEPLWVPTSKIPQAPGHPFYRRLAHVLAARGFDRFVEGLCKRFYAERLGRRSVAPGVYFRMLMIGYFEGLDSERGIAWRCADSLALREFLGYSLTEATPDHSTLSVIRCRIDLETHQEVFTWVLKVLAQEGLLKGKTIGIDATTLEANAALRSIVRRETGQGYEEFLRGLAKASGIETPTVEDLKRIDKDRKGKGSNEDWEHPHDPDAKIAKMKDGRTHMAHKSEHAVDLDTSALVAVTVQGADQGDTTRVYETVAEAAENLREVRDEEDAGENLQSQRVSELVTDRGYASAQVLEDLEEIGVRSYVPEPARGRRRWKGRARQRRAVYANRRRTRSRRGRELQRRRGQLLERSFAHFYETGAMRRTHLRGQPKILKRLVVHAMAYNFGLVMRKLWGAGTPRGLAELLFGVSRAVCAAADALLRRWHVFRDLMPHALTPGTCPQRPGPVSAASVQIALSSTGC